MRNMFGKTKLTVGDDVIKAAEANETTTQDPMARDDNAVANSQDFWDELWDEFQDRVGDLRSMNKLDAQGRQVGIKVSDDLKDYMETTFMSSDFKLGNSEILQMGMVIATILKERGYASTYRKKLVLKEPENVAENTNA